jgi:hypothetical protein
MYNAEKPSARPLFALCEVANVTPSSVAPTQFTHHNQSAADKHVLSRAVFVETKPQFAR